jgi:hypothetical protein
LAALLALRDELYSSKIAKISIRKFERIKAVATSNPVEMKIILTGRIVGF